MKRSRKLVTESSWDEFEDFYVRLQRETHHDSGVHLDVTDDSDAGKASIKVFFDDYFGWDDDVVAGEVELKEDSGLQQWIHRLQNVADKYGWDCNVETVTHYEDEPFDEGLRNDSLARITMTCSYGDEFSDEYNESTARRQPMKWKMYKENTERVASIECVVRVDADSIDEALEQLHTALISADAAVTDGNEQPNPKIVAKYNHWDKENEGDVDFVAYDDTDKFYDTTIRIFNDN